MSIAERLAARSVPEPNTGCVLWLGTVAATGYGEMKVSGEKRTVHRLAWEASHGSIPAGLCVCHHCDQRTCINPAHLFVGTDADNHRDMVSKGRQRWGTWNNLKTHCPAGHTYSGDNLMWAGPHKRHRKCRECNRASARRVRARRER